MNLTATLLPVASADLGASLLPPLSSQPDAPLHARAWQALLMKPCLDKDVPHGCNALWKVQKVVCRWWFDEPEARALNLVGFEFVLARPEWYRVTVKMN